MGSLSTDRLAYVDGGGGLSGFSVVGLARIKVKVEQARVRASEAKSQRVASQELQSYYVVAVTNVGIQPGGGGLRSLSTCAGNAAQISNRNAAGGTAGLRP